MTYTTPSPCARHAHHSTIHYPTSQTPELDEIYKTQPYIYKSVKNILIDWTASVLTTGANNVAEEIA